MEGRDLFLTQEKVEKREITKKVRMIDIWIHISIKWMVITNNWLYWEMKDHEL